MKKTPKSTVWSRENPEKAAKSQLKSRETLRGAINGRLSSARQRAKNKQLPFDINIDFVEELWYLQEGKCALSGLDMGLRANKGSKESFYSFSIDRIDSESGYTKENIQLLCWGVNLMKLTMSTTQFLSFVKEVYLFNELGE